MLLCTGGCRSGKSSFAQKWVEEKAARRVYIASAYAGDDEMARRIARHRAARGQGWETLEIASDATAGAWDEPERWAMNAASLGDAVLFDCLTLWTGLCLERGLTETATLGLTSRMLHALRDTGKPVALVSNELGMGLVPDNALARNFRDIAGLVNQKAASMADTVVFMVSGLPLYVKN